MNLTDAFLNKRLLSIFSNVVKRAHARGAAAPIRRCWRANVNGWGLRVYLFACRRPGRGGRGLTGFTGRTTAKSLSLFRMAAVAFARACLSVCDKRTPLRLVFARLLQLAVLVLNFVEQPHVIDGDHRLVGKGGQEFNLLVCERLHRRA